MITHVLYFSKFEKESSQLMCLGRAERRNASKNIISTFQRMAHTVTSFVAFTSNMQPKSDSPSGSLRVRPGCIT